MTVPPEEHKPNVKEDPEIKPTFLGGIIDLFKGNLLDTVAYIILAFGLVYSCFYHFVGGLVVGFIMGLYFSSHVFRLVKQFREFLISDGIFKGFILIAAAMAFIITAPGICLGLFLGTFVRPVFGFSSPLTEEKKEEPPEEE